MKLVIISGPPASGKSGIGRELAKRLGYEFCSKDDIKQALFDSEKHTSHDFFWYEKRAKAMFYNRIGQAVRQNTSIVMESDFMPADKKKLLPYKAKAAIVELYCTANPWTRLKRYVRRNETGARHAGHHDRRWYGSMLALTLLHSLRTTWPYGP